ncbi:uncharacterized protein N7473_011113 [Penicillium subrubescens]|uniref:Ubiquinol-cytochrome-c reductase cytochrome c1 n=1 Tax=Penicillium subrubescens TaxID=1316194 RepID=A0A1Q5UIY5_9EURO|nr:uncharacterized protein N7473_011113 [Penicillium subrubescens]KAJ5882679.1 hypothetical protein N7473_011113 [Penicillium subrubescens]OKP12437.1 hypothetical protein PENSUB_1922 [Penicillium subrubescens]
MEHKRHVYLACKAIFSAQNASIRKRKTVQKRLEDHRSSLQSLIPDFDLKKVAVICQTPLEKQIFQSEIKAKLEFPELFAPALEKDSYPLASEEEAARSEAEIIEGITLNYEREESGVDTVIPFDCRKDCLNKQPLYCDQGRVSRPVSARKPSLPSFYPSYFPYHAQHAILSTVQRVLEESCFDFAQKWFPLDIKDHGWDCAEAVELTKWTRLIQEQSSNLPCGSLLLNGSELSTALSAVHKIRHTAVHRLLTTARGIDILVVSAMRLTEVLQDTLRTSQLEDLHVDLASKIETMDLQKKALDSCLAQDLENIQLQREQLDQKEEDLKKRAMGNDQDMKSLMGLLIAETVEKVFSHDYRDQWEAEMSCFATADEGD